MYNLFVDLALRRRHGITRDSMISKVTEATDYTMLKDDELIEQVATLESMGCRRTTTSISL